LEKALKINKMNNKDLKYSNNNNNIYKGNNNKYSKSFSKNKKDWNQFEVYFIQKYRHSDNS
jgi:hypothetical protein